MQLQSILLALLATTVMAAPKPEHPNPCTPKTQCINGKSFQYICDTKITRSNGKLYTVNVPGKTVSYCAKMCHDDDNCGVVSFDSIAEKCTFYKPGNTQQVPNERYSGAIYKGPC